MLKPGFFHDLLGAYSIDHFQQPVVMSVPGTDLSGIRLVFKKEGDEVKCWPVKSEIYSGMADINVHYQMREPITGIFSLMPILADTINNGENRKAISTLEEINRRSYKLLKNVTNMTLVSKIMSGNLPTVSAINLTDLIDSLVSSVTAVQRNVKISTEIDEDIFVMGNMNFLSTAFLNLISNSIAFSTENVAEIDIKLKADKSRAIFSYKDNSKGIKDEYLADVFKPYFSKDPFADGEKDPSMGLGLFIAKTAFEQAGGKMILTSNFGNGVRYTVTIPTIDETDSVLESSATDFLLNWFSEVFIQLCDSCKLPDLK
jgi:signal transduction histidine kinase